MNQNIKKITTSQFYTVLTSGMFGLFVILTFFCPMYYSSFKKHMYYIGFLWPYAFLFAGMAMVYLRHFRDAWRKKRFAVWNLCLIIAYLLLSFYVNKVYHHWMWEEIHNTVAFLFLLMLLIYPDWEKELKFDLVKLLLVCAAVSMLCAIVFYFCGYASVQIYNNGFVLHSLQEAVEKYDEKRLSWIYYHKSQFSLMQLVFIGFAHRYYEKYKHIALYIASQVIFLLCLILSHSWTAVAALGILAGGVVMDAIVGYIRENKVKFQWKYLLFLLAAACAVLVAAGIMLWRMSKERNLLTLGSRIPIWCGGLRVIMERPMGVGKDFGKGLIDAGVFQTNNCHNVFLNAIYRFSIPVGALYIVIMIGFLFYMACRRKSWFSFCYVAALMMVLCIDYSLLSYGVAQFILFVYLTLRTEDAGQPVLEDEEERGAEDASEETENTADADVQVEEA